MVEGHTRKFLENWAEAIGPEHDTESFLIEVNRVLGRSERLQSTYRCKRNGEKYTVLSIFIDFESRIAMWIDEEKHVAVGMRRFKSTRQLVGRHP